MSYLLSSKLPSYTSLCLLGVGKHIGSVNWHLLGKLLDIPLFLYNNKRL